MRRLRVVLAALGLALGAVWFGNASAIWAPSGRPTILAHRGLAQEFSREGLTRDTCTARRMLPPVHAYMENTLASMRAAFDLGADIVEIDVHPTTDGDFAVFHDWTLDCRTNGHGVTREHTMAELKALDIGHGYTADGRTFPFRGRYVGAMPSLSEVLAAFPKGRFLVNIKSNDPTEGDLLAGYIASRGLPVERMMFYGGERPIDRLAALAPGARILTKARLRACLTRYLIVGWTGRVPVYCANMALFVPTNLRGLAWGWPNLFVKRMARANSEVFLIGPLRPGAAGNGFVDDPGEACRLGRGFAGGLITDRIERVGPALRRPNGCARPS